MKAKSKRDARSADGATMEYWRAWARARKLARSAINDLAAVLVEERPTTRRTEQRLFDALNKLEAATSGLNC